MAIDRQIFVEVSDGTRIALTVYRPDSSNDGPFPAIVESLPYRKDDDCTARDFSTYAYLASRGFAGVRIDVRGTGASTGIIEDEYLVIEQSDNLEILKWVADQQWCTGDLGMWGISWGGFSSLQTAMLRPPQLKAIAAMHASHDRFACDVHYIGGSLHAAEQVDWPPSMISTNALPPDPDIFGEEWFDEWMRRLDHTPQWPLEWLKHQLRDSYWRHGSPSADYAAIECPTLLIGGWLDGYVDGMLALAEHLTCPTRTLIGPWGHYRPATGVPGPTYDHLDLMARWFGHHLRGDDNGVMALPSVTAFIRTEPPYDDAVVTGYWRGEAAWPAPGVIDQEWHLDQLADGRMLWNGPQWVGKHAPAWDRSGITSIDSGADDRSSITFTTAPLSEPIEILGTPEVELALTTDRPFGMVAARLLLVDPLGRTHLICRGNRNLVFPRSLSEPEPPTPGEKLLIKFPLMATSAVVPAGWRLRLAIAGADFPIVWPPPGPFTLSVDPSGSRLRLPTTQPDQTHRAIDIQMSHPPPEPPVEFTREEATWAVSTRDRRTTFSRHVASEQVQPTRNDLTYSSDQSWMVAVDEQDPGTTAVQSSSDLTLSRPGWDIAVSAGISISGSDAFEVVIDLAARHNDVEVWRRSWQESITRRWV